VATKVRRRGKKRPTKSRSKRDVDVAAVEAKIFDVTESSPYVRLLCYGPNGKGKTRLGASFPNPLIIDINEEGTRSAAGYKGAKVYPCGDWDDLSAVYWYLHKGNHPYDTVVIDTLTQMQVLAMRQVMGEKVIRDPDADPDSPRIQDYGTANTKMGDLILRFRNLPMHVVFLAQERTVGDPDEGEEVLTTVDLPNGSRKFATGAVGIIGRIYHREVKTKNKQGKRRTSWQTAMLVGPHDEYTTKDRTNNLGRIAPMPDGSMIIKAWEDWAANEEE